MHPQVVELEPTHSFKVAFWSMGNFALDGLDTLVFTSYQLERQGAKHKTKVQLTGRASDSAGLHVLGHPAKTFPPFDHVTLIGVYLPGSTDLQVSVCSVYNVEVDRQGKGYSDPNDPVNANKEEDKLPEQQEEEALPSTAKQYRDKRKAAIESFGTAKKMRSFGQVAERLDRECEVANLDKYSESISDRVEGQLKAKQTAEEKDQQTKLEVLPPFVHSDDPHKVYAEPRKHQALPYTKQLGCLVTCEDGLQNIVSDDAVEEEPHLLDEGPLLGSESRGAGFNYGSWTTPSPGVLFFVPSVHQLHVLRANLPYLLWHS